MVRDMPQNDRLTDRARRRALLGIRASLWIYRQWALYIIMAIVILADWVRQPTATREDWVLVPAAGLVIVSGVLFRWSRRRQTLSDGRASGQNGYPHAP
jgi:hypothetical protein